MRKPNLKKLSLGMIAEITSRSGVKTARCELAGAIGAAVEITGRVQKIVGRDEVYKLIVQPDDVPGFVVFADCPSELKKQAKASVRKGARVTVRGSLLAFGASAVNLSACRLVMAGDAFETLQKGTGKT